MIDNIKDKRGRPIPYSAFQDTQGREAHTNTRSIEKTEQIHQTYLIVI